MQIFLMVLALSLVGVLVVPAGMDKGLLEQAQVTDREADRRGERVGGTHRVGGRPSARQAR